jgi:holliday junction DNA helicase RuvA
VIARLAGRLESVDDTGGCSALLIPSLGLLPPVAPPIPVAGGLAIEVLLPAYLAKRLKAQVGQSITLHTLLYLEGQGQGTSFIPRLLGFASPSERDFFELFTTVKGIGNRKALRALALPPAEVAAAITRRDTRALVELPEIGKRLAETVVAELVGKVDAFLLGDLGDPDRPARPTLEAKPRPPAEQDAISALCSLGESRPDAERKVDQALARLGPAERGRADRADQILALVYAGR